MQDTVTAVAGTALAASVQDIAGAPWVASVMIKLPGVAALAGLSATNIANSLQVSSKARNVKVIFDMDVPDFVAPDHRTSSDNDVWDTYIATNKDVDGVDIDELNKLAKTYIND